MNVLEELAAAAARGVQVTIITNASEPPPLTLKWQFREHRDGETAKFRGAGYDLFVQDCDDDASQWWLTRGREVIAKGSTNDWKPYYHFDACLLAAEAALRTVVRERRAAILAANTGSP